MAVSKISRKGQITIPKEIRESIGVEAGDFVGYQTQGDKVLLMRVEPFDAAFHQALSSTMEEWASPQDEEAFRDL
ncbi:MAG: AbrB/MazE/SpoVT family DNA-binding domain-containing protein [Acidobacteriota bacterium]